jgi:hypothetical protein
MELALRRNKFSKQLAEGWRVPTASPASNRPGNCVRCWRLQAAHLASELSIVRLIVLIVALFAAGTPAGAQGWKEYEYPNETFTAAFPGEPKAETTSYQAPGGRLVEARVYSVLQEGGEFKITVADMSDTRESEGNVMAYAVFRLSRRGELKFNIPHVTRRIIGRQAIIDGADGSETYASVFFHNRRLYQIEGTVPAGGSTADAFRFQQSFDFTDGWRRPDALSNEPGAR